MAEIEFEIGQRWISNSEAELGLGIIKQSSQRRVEVSFPAAGEQRTYASNIAPLSRIQYPVGDRVKTDDDVSFVIKARHELKGCFIYQGEDDAGNEISIHEMNLSSFVEFNQPQERLFAGQVDKNSQFELRTQALAHQHRLQSRSVFGLLGARVQLLPHQLYIAHQVAQRHAPRVLLADEVGLGKTIEAGLIIHQQLLTGRAQRVLIVVPDSLVHQWLVEMLRRFNLQFTIMDEDRHEGLVEAGEINPFDSAQLMLCSLSMLISNPAIYADALATDWDLMVVDEAHHLSWREEQQSLEYQCIDGLAREVAGLLLLTATPEQLGVESHFARLRLLDPDRYFDLATFREQEANYQVISTLVTKLLSDNIQSDLPSLRNEIEAYLGKQSFAKLAQTEAFEKERDAVIQALLDQHGTGRILFRNTRDAVSGFPERKLMRHVLTMPSEYQLNQSNQDTLGLLQAEVCIGDDWLTSDSRVTWLADFLAENKHEKILVICAQAETAVDLEQCLRIQYGVRSSVFHEGLSIVNRDRAAAYFADEEEGAQVLICSEIGSEGRNFQFSHHLVLFDLPLNPDLLEQRIGRLDRIGQHHDVLIHIPYYENSAQSVLVDWYDKGMQAFSQVFSAGGSIYQAVKETLHHCLHHTDDQHEIDKLIKQTANLTQETIEVLQQGRDRLLELNSCNVALAEDLVADLEEATQISELADFMDKVFDEYGVEQQVHSADSIIVEPGNHMLQHQFPGLPEDGLTATYHRHRALVREDMTFLSWEHPMVLGSLDMIINGDFGNSAFCTLESENFAAGTLLLESIFTIKCPAPKSLQLGRYLNHSYLRVVIDQKGRDFNQSLDEATFNALAGRIPKATAQELIRHARPMINDLIVEAKKVAAKQQADIIEQAISTMHASLQPEQDRLTALAKVNANIREQEIQYIADAQTQLAGYLAEAQLSLDAIRVAIVSTD